MSVSHIATRMTLAAFVVLYISCAFAQEDDGPPPAKDLELSVGAGALAAPAYLGAKQTQILAVPELKITYRDEFFASQEDGIGYNFRLSQDWIAGPIARIAFNRPENGRNPLAIAGTRSDALRGLGSVGTTVETGGFAEYQWNALASRLEIRKGVDGHRGVIGDVSSTYTRDIHGLFYTEGPPLILVVGPKLTLANDRFERTYFGVDTAQSAKSGLPVYQPSGGIVTYGANATLILPITYTISATLLAGYDRLAGDVAAAPLVRQRGSANQASGGLILSYTFGYNTH